MKFQEHFQTLLVTGTVGLLALAACAQSNEARLFGIKLTTLKEEYLAGEPVSVTVRIVYHGKENLAVPHPLDKLEYLEDLEVAPTNGSSFIRYVTPDERRDALKDRSLLPKIGLAPGSEVVRQYWLESFPALAGPPSTAAAGELFPHLGDYVIRFTVTLSEKRYTSRTVVRIEEPIREPDKQAYEWLERQQLMRMLASLASSGHDTPKVLNRLATLQDTYHDSVYAEFARGFMPRTVAVQNENKAPQDALSVITSQLERQGYDWRGFMREQSPAAREYRAKELSILEASPVGARPPEVYKKIGELLAAYVKEFVKPVSPEDLKRRYDELNKAEAERLASQQEEQKRRVKEDEKKLREQRGGGPPK